MSKKFLFICFLLGMFMFMPAGAHAASDDETITGDVNGDGVLDVTDVMVLANYISNPSAQTLNKDVADVNGDGTVDSSDIDALINKVLGIVTKYYWYVGQTNPSTMTEISPIVSDTSSSGWRLIGTTIGTYNSSSKLYDAINNPISSNPSSNDYWYVAVPSESSLAIYDSDDVEQVSQGNFTKSTTTINNIKYNVYKTAGTSRKFKAYYIY